MNCKDMIDFYIKREVLDDAPNHLIYEAHKPNIKNILHLDSCLYEYAMKKISRKMGI